MAVRETWGISDRGVVNLKTQSACPSRHGGPSAPGELLERILLVASSGGEWWWGLRVVSTGVEWRLQAVQIDFVAGREVLTDPVLAQFPMLTPWDTLLQQE